MKVTPEKLAKHYDTVKIEDYAKKFNDNVLRIAEKQREERVKKVAKSIKKELKRTKTRVAAKRGPGRPRKTV
jgi:ABC-type Fe3+-hydroxamate transport system substrate-binding protein